MSVRPFSPTESFAFPKPPSAGGKSRPVSPSSSGSTFITANAATSPTPSFETAENPFEDHVEKPEFQPIETIRRPFTPSMEDELTVKPGDTVRIIKVFDDGWTFVEKLGANPAERSERERGLIPVDCLREAGQPLPTFISEKRVSSYAGANFEGPNYEELLAQIMSGNNAHAA
ncbi:hypothetical protein CONPUDRAFT_56438 [Coniophora puteana RWD-64-598 SS2]|uniref:SH3 domain-containing protein n=1 Tax=Coniophora puteana (strain RWD-64-598) TaxID=741705 RepID=A0A5M3MPW9_CONPW|nr:uncharacterized protein CONPUDRAFT_56438 [Coniophora puteana RWD-64-598 SS2]EIW81228.1 hypothetical protein CONPUDRAFT_56438 [Coniophora puteana RWD-64-598 SS2]